MSIFNTTPRQPPLPRPHLRHTMCMPLIKCPRWLRHLFNQHLTTLILLKLILLKAMQHKLILLKAMPQAPTRLRGMRLQLSLDKVKDGLHLKIN